MLTLFADYKPAMKGILPITFSLLMLVANPNSGNGQAKSNEPEFANTIVALTKDHGVISLERQKAQVKTGGNASLLLVGVGTAKMVGFVKGDSSDVKLAKSDTLTFIARLKDNSANPNDVITFAKFQVNSKKHIRYIEIAKSGVLSQAEQGKVDYIKFEGQRYGNSSYLVKVFNLPEGEYMMTLQESRETAHMFSVK